MAEGIITRQDLITDDALSFGQEYAKNIKQIIISNDEIKKSAKEIFEIFKELSNVTTQEKFIEAKRKETLATLEAKNAIKLQEEALKSAERIKREVIRTDKAVATGQANITKVIKKTSVAWKEQDQLEKNLISTKRKNELATESTNRALVASREVLKRQNLEIRRSLTTMGQLISKRDQARKSVQNLQAQVALGKKLSDAEQRELKQSTAAFQKYDAAIRIIKQNTNQFQESVGKYPDLFRSVGSSIKQLLPILGVAGTIRAVFGIVKDATRTIIDFDRQIIAVQKTTNLASPEIKLLKNEIISLGLELKGVSIQGLADSAEVAGQLGIKGRKNILGFAKAIEILKISAKGIGEESVASFAKFIEVSKDNAENADRLSSVITDLGNNFATTEKEVINSAIAIQKGVQIYNVSAEAVLGLAAATTSLGVQDAAARTTIRKTFGVIQQAIFTGKNLTDVLRLTRLTQEELSDQFESDATGVFIKFLKGLNDMTEGGENTHVVLQNMKLAGDRVAPTLLSLASKHELTADAVNRANKEYVENTAALKEAELASKSLDVIIGDLSNTWDGLILSIESGDGKISGAFKNVAGFLEGAIKGLILFNETFDDMLIRISDESLKSSFDFQLGFLNTLEDDEAEKFAIRRLDRTDERIEAERKLLATLKKQKADLDASIPGRVAQALPGASLLGLDFEERIEISTRRLATLEGHLRAYDKILGITGETIKENSSSLTDNTGEIIRNVSFIRAQIKAHREKLDLVINRDEAKVIQEKVKLLKEELVAILGTASATKKKRKDINDAFNLDRQRLQQNIDGEKQIIKDIKASSGERLSASLTQLIESKKLLVLERDQAIKNAKNRTDEITRIEEQFNKDIEDLQIKHNANSEKILKDAFEKANKRILDKKKAEDAEFKLQESKLRNQLAIDLSDASKSLDERLFIQEQFEKDLHKIKTDAAIKGLQIQIGAVEQELQIANLSFEQRKNLELQLAALKASLANAQLNGVLRQFDLEVEAQERLQEFKKQKIQETSQIIAESLNLDASNLEKLITGFTEGFEGALDAIASSAAVAGDILNSVFAGNIDNIDRQIDKNDELFQRQFEAAEGDRDQQDAIRAEQELKRRELESLKKKEQIKQAKVAKAFAVFTIGISTAQAVIAALAPPPVGLGPIFGIPLAVTAGAFGLAQIAAVLARPIPKFAKGTDYHLGGLAEVSEERPEVIKEPGRSPYIQKKRAILDLKRGTKVYPNVEDYSRMENDSLLASFNDQLNNILTYNSVVNVVLDTEELVGEMRQVKKAIINQRIGSPKVQDIPHEMFRHNNTDWGN